MVLAKSEFLAMNSRSLAPPKTTKLFAISIVEEDTLPRKAYAFKSSSFSIKAKECGSEVGSQKSENQRQRRIRFEIEIRKSLVSRLGPKLEDK